MPACRTFDWNALVARMDGDEDFVRNLLEIALRTSAAAPAELRAACAAADLPLLARLAHKVKGTAGDLSAEPLREQARAAELAARAGDADAVQKNLGLAEAVDAFLAELRELTAAR